MKQLHRNKRKFFYAKLNDVDMEELIPLKEW